MPAYIVKEYKEGKGFMYDGLQAKKDGSGHKYNRVMCLLFQAEDGIRDWSVTGVQTCALPISLMLGMLQNKDLEGQVAEAVTQYLTNPGSLEIGRASCRERV